LVQNITLFISHSFILVRKIIIDDLNLKNIKNHYRITFEKILYKTLAVLIKYIKIR